ncbi:MAG: Ion channel [Ignavibacteria bacterium]|nr:Ion channel [Ignavibacteria bacterium]
MQIPEYTYEISNKNFDFSKFEDIYLYNNSETILIKTPDKSITSQLILEFCCPELEEIYCLIDENKDLNLNYCYLEGFSISNYRKSRNLLENALITIKNFSAKNAFFNKTNENNLKRKVPPNNLDMSYINFVGDNFHIRNTIFMEGNLNFTNSIFNVPNIRINKCRTYEGKINFSDCKFTDCELDFSESEFGKGDKSFANSEFGKCRLKFIASDFSDGVLDFSFSKFEKSDFDFHHAKFNKSKIDFSKASLGAGNKDFSHVDFDNCDLFFLNTKFNDGNIYFHGSKFISGDIDFFRARFGEGIVDFSYIQFGKGVKNFSSVRFGDGDVNFSNTDFGSGDIYFSKSVFGKGNKDFSHGKIGKGKIDFNEVNFGNGIVNFCYTMFGDGQITFHKAIFEDGRMDFSYVKFGKGDMDFSYVDFKNGIINFGNSLFTQNKISFYNSILPVISFQMCQFNNYTDLRVNRCNILDLSNTIFRDIIDLKPDGIAFVNINQFNFAEVKNSGLIYIDWKLNKIKQSIMVQENTTLRQKAEQFRMLKENFHQIGQYDYEDDSYVEYKRIEIKSDYISAVKRNDILWLNKLSRIIIYFFKWLVFDQVGRFGTSPVRVLKTMLVTFLFFIFLYYPLQEVPDFDDRGINVKGITTIEDAAYFSAYSILIIGYDDYHPKGITGFLSVVESFTGLFLMSYFTIAFVRKVLR